MLWLLSADAPYVSCQTAVVPVPASRFITLAKWPRAAEFSLGDSEALVEACEWESRMPWSGQVPVEQVLALSLLAELKRIPAAIA